LSISQKQNTPTTKTKIMKPSFKNLLLATLTVVAFSTSAFATKGEKNKSEKNTTNAKALAEFKKTFANAENVTLITTKDNYTEFSFSEKGIAMKVFYDLDGTMVASGKAVKFDELPQKAIKSIGKHFPSPNYVIKECVQMTLDEVGTNYYVSVEDLKYVTVLQIDDSGNVSTFSKIKK
jgi:hypothetical protein